MTEHRRVGDDTVHLRVRVDAQLLGEGVLEVLREPQVQHALRVRRDVRGLGWAGGQVRALMRRNTAALLRYSWLLLIR